MDEKARARLRQAQQEEAEALAAVASAARKLKQTQDKMAAAVTRHQKAVDAAELSVASAQKRLVAVSGLERSSALLDQSLSSLRAAVRTAATDSEDSPGRSPAEARHGQAPTPG
ncbi:MAG: hypothetical protein ACTHOK_01015 [Nocardioidaceae bacterium]